MEKRIGEKFKPKDGPFFQTLDKSLKELNVERQAYQGGTFVGNHVHKLLKVRDTSIMLCYYSYLNLHIVSPRVSTSCWHRSQRRASCIALQWWPTPRQWLTGSGVLWKHLLNVITFIMVMLWQGKPLHNWVRDIPIWKIVDKHKHFYRTGHSSIPEVLPERVSVGYRAPQDAYSRGSCYPMVGEMEHWGRTDGGAGCRVLACPCPQTGDKLRQYPK